MQISLAWHMRKTSPASAEWLMSTAPSALSTTRTVPALGSSNVLSCDPYSSA